ncbi:uncharacterized protein LOC134697429 [Mytilus trossulus]|uniref:uncharacterized protein LOC134697429 n=1 Tax=Mytilus trossulus TaxID=6551 RepID=UPI003005800A
MDFLKAECMAGLLYYSLTTIGLIWNTVLGNVFGVSAGNKTSIHNFSCFTFDWEEYVLCSWDYNTQFYSPNVTVKWHLMGSSARNDCPNLGNKSCKWIIDKDIDVYSNFKVCIKIYQSNEPQCYPVDIPSLVKPSPIRQIDVRAVNSTSATLQWPNNRILVCYNKSFQVNIMWSGKLAARITCNVTSSPSQCLANENVIICSSNHTNLSINGCSNYTTNGYGVICSSNSISITINRLSKYTEYGVVIYSKPLVKGFWSEGGYTTLTTSKDVPSTSPLIYDGYNSVRTNMSSSELTITVYWMPLNDENWNGENILFKVEIFANDSLIESKETEETFVSFETSGIFQLAILVWSKNEMGLSQQHSRLLVGKGDLIHNPVMVEVSNQMYNISWLPLTHKHGMKYSLFWCEQAFSLVCKTSPQTIEINMTYREIYIPAINQSVQYLIGVSYHYLNQTSGFEWSDCVFMGNSWNLNLDVVFRPILNLKQLEVYWYFEKCNLPEVKNLVKSYEVTACEDESCANFTTTLLDGTKTSLRLPLMNICIRITPYTVHGKGVPHKRCYINDETAYITERNLTAFYIVSVSVAVLCCPIAVIYLCRKYKRWSKGLTDIDTTTVVQSTSRVILNGRMRHGDNGFSGVPLISDVVFNGFISCNQVQGSLLSESSSTYPNTISKLLYLSVTQKDTPVANMSDFTSVDASGETLCSQVTSDKSIESYVDAQQIQPGYPPASHRVLLTKGNSDASETICSNVAMSSLQTDVCDNLSLLPTKQCAFSTSEIDSYVVEGIVSENNCLKRDRSEASSCLNKNCYSAGDLQTLNLVGKLQINGENNYLKAQLISPESFAVDSNSDYTQETSDCSEELMYLPHNTIELSMEVRKDSELSNQRERDILENSQISPLADFYFDNDSVTESANFCVQQQNTGFIKELKEPLMSTHPIPRNSNYS